MRITRVHRPSPGRKNLRVGVVRSGSHHSADSTHRLALHARPFCATPLRCSTPPKRQTSTASNPDAHALCYTPTGHVLLSAARRFVRSTQNIEAIAAQLSARRTSGSPPIRRAACGVLDPLAFLCKNVSILPRARHVPHRPPAILLFSLKKTSFSPRKVKGSGGNPQITSAPATRR